MAVCYASCEDDENPFYMYEMAEVYDPNIPVQSIYMSIISGATVGIKGGTPPYTVTISNEELATLTMQEEDIVRITPLRLGVSTLVATDSKGAKAQIEVRVGEGRKVLHVNEVSATVSGEMDESRRNEITDWLLAQADTGKEGSFVFSYNSKESGNFTIEPAALNEDAPDIESTFQRSLEPWNGKNSYKFTTFYNREEHVFYLQGGYPQSNATAVRDQGPTPAFLVTDLTAQCKEKYPEVTEALLFYIGNYW